ncbi:MAG: lipocalin family protein [Methylophilaceae bacterium]|jgi:apolipoprotein D and lipocalin family protein|nr:lipocalin family protein [Methylophilaceae bacterium]MDG1453370.1 lipocalin family protein [Methylophilaceae bacterium]
MKKLLLLVLLLLNSCMGVPENVEIVDGVKPEQYLGTWYEISRLDHSFERGLDNVTAHYEQNADGSIKVINRGYNREDKKWDEAVGKAYFIEKPNADNTYLGKLKVSFFGPFYGAYNIIALDKVYYNYVMICGPGKDYLWILSRTPELTYPIKQELVSQANALGFATDKLIYVNQNPDIANYEAGQHVIQKK